jgi:glycosyltransferase involved in cell wall biosynthesis
MRRLDVLLAVPRIAHEIRERKPRVLLSAGNHVHWAAGPAYVRAGRPATTRLMGRASNAPPNRDAPLLGGLARAWDARKYNEMERIIAVSHELAGLLIRRLGLDERTVTTIPNGVDIAAVEIQAAKPLDDPWFAPGAPPVIVGAGRLSRQKNFPLLIKAFALLRRERNVRLVILGDGPQRTRLDLLELAGHLSVAEDVSLQGFEPNPMRFFARAGLFVLSSNWEGASNVILEAMAAGCPVVATNCPTGVQEQLDNGRLGPIVAMDDPPALARAMSQRLDQPRGSDALRENARRYGQEAMLDAYFRLFTGEA